MGRHKHTQNNQKINKQLQDGKQTAFHHPNYAQMTIVAKTLVCNRLVQTTAAGKQATHAADIVTVVTRFPAVSSQNKFNKFANGDEKQPRNPTHF